MGRYTEAVCRLCRREGEKLFLKGERCHTSKCAVERSSYPPGQHWQARRRKVSTYAMQLREKQKTRRFYGVLERQFRRYFEKAQRMRGLTGENLMQLLERRLDNVIYRLGMALSRAHARQLITHGHVQVNGRKVDITSYQVRPGEEITLEKSLRENPDTKRAREFAEGREAIPWLAFEPETFVGKLLYIPTRAEIPVTFQEQIIVELYSK